MVWDRKLLDFEIAEALRVLLDTLPERERDVLTMLFLQGMTRREASKAIINYKTGRKGVTLERFRQIMNRALRMMRRPPRRWYLREVYREILQKGQDHGS